MALKFIVKNESTIFDCNLTINFHSNKSKSEDHIKVLIEKEKNKLLFILFYFSNFL